ncbi:MAG: hypothetical protein ABSB15_25685 [Bryobacteraceae bacterium]|jgi:hypothetical protein
MKTVKNKTDRISKTILVAVLMALGSVATAQTPPPIPPPVYHPGAMIRVNVTFAGSDAMKISRVWMNLSLTTPIQIGQAGFLDSIGSGESKKTAPDTFEVSYTIPTNQASGEYRLEQINTIIDQDAPIRFSYGSPDSFPVRTFKIENSKTIVKPTIASVSVP